jgi:hypothetical protein
MNWNTLQLIVLCLTWKDLATFAQTWRKARVACDLDHVWYAETVRVFLGELKLFRLSSKELSAM